ncbi:TetR/AcrR family transcriptional regulator [uncultured Aeromicrobium sp.]|uniref:TetR/AcrR family transcriptional regulator n=1 Tax=uncultured Aeromicrobium sp. TaxID=337820 RepID=UPI0025FCC944|nr:TetR/AcrR family transcriptional regulator [uncultured Aeromicrobium sp.]
MTRAAKPSSRQRRTPVVSPEPRELPTTPRGIRTRAKLVDAARTVFERDGFLDARLIDITNEAGISAGSFYTYFDSKEEIFAAVLASVEEEMLHPHVRALTAGDDPVELIRAANRAYLESYRRNAAFMRLLLQVSSIDEEFAQLRRRRGEAFAQRNARSIQDLQERGVAKAKVDPYKAASALSGMVGRAAYAAFIIGEEWDFEELVETLTQLWANSLLISTGDAT